MLQPQGNMDCKRCGWCCTIPAIAISQSDILRWNQEHRTDILIQVSFIANYPKVGRAGFYIAETTFNPKQPCPFFEEENGLSACSIHETKPLICRDFPTSKPKEMNCPINVKITPPIIQTEGIERTHRREFIKTARQSKQLLNLLYRIRGLKHGK